MLTEHSGNGSSPGENSFSLMIMLVNDKPEEGSMYNGFSGKQVYADHMKLGNEAFRCLDFDIESVQYLEGDEWKEIVPPLCEKKAVIGHWRLLSRADWCDIFVTERAWASKSFYTNASCALEWIIQICSEMFREAWQRNLRMGIGLNLARGRAIPLAGWNDEEESKTEGMLIKTEILGAIIGLCVINLCKNGRTRESLKLFHKEVNELDPPIDLNGDCVVVTWIPTSLLVEELFKEEGWTDVGTSRRI